MAGSAIQAAGVAEFEDGLKSGSQSDTGNILQKVCTVPKTNAIIIPVVQGRSLPGKNKFQIG